MSRKKQLRSKEQFASALELERAGDIPGALKLYQKSTTTDPANSHSWNRQMILMRKAKSKEKEVKLIKLAITAFQQSLQSKQQDWLKKNQAKADSTRELAEVLGLLEPTGLPKSEHAVIEKWQTRLYLLEYRIKNARKKKSSSKKPKSQSRSQPTYLRARCTFKVRVRGVSAPRPFFASNRFG